MTTIPATPNSQAFTIFNSETLKKKVFLKTSNGASHLALSDVPLTEDGLLQRLRMEKIIGLASRWMAAHGIETSFVTDTTNAACSIAIHGCLDNHQHADNKKTQNWMRIGLIKHNYTIQGATNITPRLIVEAHHPEVIQLLMLRTHYRENINFHKRQMEDANHVLTKLYRALRDTHHDNVHLDWRAPFANRFAAALNDDFNTPRAFATLYALADSACATKSPALARQLLELGTILGLFSVSPEQYFSEQAKSSAKISKLFTLSHVRPSPKVTHQAVHLIRTA
jgi:hypothetical protein